jgi:threonine dehydrogenase-like Zn-dependent dehydrogenase
MASSIPDTCKAAALLAPGEPLAVIDVPLPTGLEPGAILVRNTSATVCATDVHLWEGSVGSKDAGSQFPVILGHEMTGRVVRFGDGVAADSIGQPLREGDRIVWTHGFCGQCTNCVVEHQPTVCTNRRGYMFSKCTEYPYLTGGFAEYCYVYPTSGRIRVPDEVSDELASASSCALRTVVHGFDRLGSLDDRHTVVIQGSGPLGLFAVAKAVTSGPANVIVVGGPKGRLALAEEWGASRTIDVTEITDPATRQQLVQDYTGGRGADVVIEVSGAPSAFPEGMQLLRPGGRYLIIGQIHSQSLPFNASSIVLKHATLIGSNSGSVEHYWRGLEFLRHNAHRFAWLDMISNHYSLTDINEAFRNMRALTEIKPAIDFAVVDA